MTGLQYNCFNVGCGQTQLASAVATWNSTLAGTKDARGQTIPTLVLPAHYQFSAPIIDQDVRLTKEFALRERYKLQVFGEVFNVFNIANLSGLFRSAEHAQP